MQTNLYTYHSNDVSQAEMAVMNGPIRCDSVAPAESSQPSRYLSL